MLSTIQLQLSLLVEYRLYIIILWKIPNVAVITYSLTVY